MFLSQRNLGCNLFVCLDDLVRERRNDLLNRAFPFVTLLESFGRKHGLREAVEISSGGLKREKDENGEKIENVVHGRTGKGALKLISVADCTLRRKIKKIQGE